jgi:hypothetical protein
MDKMNPPFTMAESMFGFFAELYLIREARRGGSTNKGGLLPIPLDAPNRVTELQPWL